MVKKKDCSDLSECKIKVVCSIGCLATASEIETAGHVGCLCHHYGHLTNVSRWQRICRDTDL